MKTLRLTVDLTYDEKLWHSGDDDTTAKEWFYKRILGDDEGLILHSQEAGDEVGQVIVQGYINDPAAQGGEE